MNSHKFSINSVIELNAFFHSLKLIQIISSHLFVFFRSNIYIFFYELNNKLNQNLWETYVKSNFV